MTIDRWIALITGAGACLSAIATFLTVRQIARQREASYQPELVLCGIDFSAMSGQDNRDVLPTRWLSDTAGPSPLVQKEASIPVRNVGLGAAKSIILTWSFPVEQMVNYVNEAAQRTLTPAYFSIDEWGVSVKSKTLGDEMSMWKNQQRTSLDFILPASVEIEPVTISLPHAYILLSSAMLFFGIKDEKSKDPLIVPPLRANMEYLDIGNRKHKSSFEIDLQVSVISMGGSSFEGLLDCKKCA
jgi:hypothetical protein